MLSSALWDGQREARPPGAEAGPSRERPGPRGAGRVMPTTVHMKTAAVTCRGEHLRGVASSPLTPDHPHARGIGRAVVVRGRGLVRVGDVTVGLLVLRGVTVVATESARVVGNPVTGLIGARVAFGLPSSWLRIAGCLGRAGRGAVPGGSSRTAARSWCYLWALRRLALEVSTWSRLSRAAVEGRPGDRGSASLARMVRASGGSCSVDPSGTVGVAPRAAR